MKVESPLHRYGGKKHNGRIVKVSDDQIIEAQSDLSASAGLFTEPAGSTAWAGFKKAADELEKDALVVIMATGNGLKDIGYALETSKKPVVVPVNIKAAAKALGLI